MHFTARFEVRGSKFEVRADDGALWEFIVSFFPQLGQNTLSGESSAWHTGHFIYDLRFKIDFYELLNVANVASVANNQYSITNNWKLATLALATFSHWQHSTTQCCIFVTGAGGWTTVVGFSIAFSASPKTCDSSFSSWASLSASILRRSSRTFAEAPSAASFARA